MVVNADFRVFFIVEFSVNPDLERHGGHDNGRKGKCRMCRLSNAEFNGCNTLLMSGFIDSRTSIMDQFGIDFLSFRPLCRTKSLARIRERAGAANTVGWPDRRSRHPSAAKKTSSRLRRQLPRSFGHGPTSTVRTAPLVRPRRKDGGSGRFALSAGGRTRGVRTVEVELCQSPQHLPPKEATHLLRCRRMPRSPIRPAGCVRSAGPFPDSSQGSCSARRSKR